MSTTTMPRERMRGRPRHSTHRSAAARRCSFGALTPDGHHVETITGGYVDISAPDPADIRLADIAAGLSKLCRGGGQVPFFSVAEHALLVSHRLTAQGHGARVALSGLHHDDPEAYVQDLVKPLKELMAHPWWLRRLPRLGKRRVSYQEIENRLWQAIAAALALEELDIHAEAVKQADTWALAAEKHYLRRSRGTTWYCYGAYTPGQPPLRLGLSPDAAAEMWLAEHARLVGQVERAAPQSRPA